MRLKNQVAIVTGGGGHLGQAICLGLAREGAHVVVSDFDLSNAEDVSKQVAKEGRRSLALKTDVRRAEQCKEMVGKTIHEMGGLDILVCNAGITGFSFLKDSKEPVTIENIPEKVWDETIDVNLKGVFLCNQAVTRHFKKQKKGRIINFSSVAGRKGLDYMAPYCASKAGVIVLSQAVAMHLARYDVTVNTICPGIIWTPMWDEIIDVLQKTYSRYRNMAPEEVIETVIKTSIPKKKPQSPEDIANAVIFLASDEASEITGQALGVDGGMHFS
jgi:NAD(P)-dependent dehydrogenase (short-subunit alcohol dehydrogenase family)